MHIPRLLALSPRSPLARAKQTHAEEQEGIIRLDTEKLPLVNGGYIVSTTSLLSLSLVFTRLGAEKKSKKKRTDNSMSQRKQTD